MGVCNSKPVRCATVRGVCQGDRVAHVCLQRSGSRQHSMGICDSRPFVMGISNTFLPFFGRKCFCRKVFCRKKFGRKSFGCKNFGRNILAEKIFAEKFSSRRRRKWKPRRPPIVLVDDQESSEEGKKKHGR